MKCVYLSSIRLACDVQMLMRVRRRGDAGKRYILDFRKFDEFLEFYENSFVEVNISWCCGGEQRSCHVQKKAKQ